jgi:hypothetical protein
MTHAWTLTEEIEICLIWKECETIMMTSSYVAQMNGLITVKCLRSSSISSASEHRSADSRGSQRGGDWPHGYLLDGGCLLQFRYGNRMVAMDDGSVQSMDGLEFRAALKN